MSASTNKVMSMDRVVLLDITDKPFVVDCLSLCMQLQEHDFKLCGFDIPTLLELRKQYILRGGPLDPSPESVRVIFRL